MSDFVLLSFTVYGYIWNSIIIVVINSNQFIIKKILLGILLRTIMEKGVAEKVFYGPCLLRSGVTIFVQVYALKLSYCRL